MESFLLVICLLIGGSVAIDFTTIGQKEIVDYIKNRADLIHGKKFSERNLQDLLSNAVFTGLEEEALVFAYGSNVDDSDLNVDQLSTQFAVLASSSSSDNVVPLRIVLTSDTLGTTNIATSTLTTTKSSSSKSSVGDFVVNCVQQQSFDSTNLDGSITINLGASTDSHNLTLTKTIYIGAEVNVTSLGSDWEPSASQLTDEGKLLSMLSSKEGSLYVITYQSLIRETIKANEGNLFGGLKSEGKVLVVVGANGVISLSGRTISGKIEANWEDEVEEHVDTFLTLNGSKSRKSQEMSQSVSNDKVGNWIYSTIAKKLSSNTVSRHSRGSKGSGYNHRSGSSHRGRYGNNLRSGSSYKGHSGQHKSNWKPSCSDGSTWPSWRSFWEFGFSYRFGWGSFFDDDDFDMDYDYDRDWTPMKHGSTPSTQKPKVTTTTPKPVKTVKPIVSTPAPTVHQESSATTEEQKVEATTMAIPATTIPEATPKPEEKPDLSEPALPNLPRGTTVSLWSTRIV